MARYYDLDKLSEMIQAKADTMIEGKGAFLYVANWLAFLPTADVAPKSEVDRLEYTLLGVMHSVDKWLEGDELEQDEVNRAATMREKTLRIIETLKTEVAMEIFELIDCAFSPVLVYNGYTVKEYLAYIKKKYTEGKE